MNGVIPPQNQGQLGEVAVVQGQGSKEVGEMVKQLTDPRGWQVKLEPGYRRPNQVCVRKVLV